MRIWLVLAIIGLAGGITTAVALPTASVSSARLLLTHRDGEDPTKAMATDASLATTRTVAERTIEFLKLPETPDDLLKEYTVAPLTDRVLEIKVSAKTSEDATRLATDPGADVPDLPQGADRAPGGATQPRSMSPPRTRRPQRNRLWWRRVATRTVRSSRRPRR